MRKQEETLKISPHRLLRYEPALSALLKLINKHSMDFSQLPVFVLSRTNNLLASPLYLTHIKSALIPQNKLSRSTVEFSFSASSSFKEIRTLPWTLKKRICWKCGLNRSSSFLFLSWQEKNSGYLKKTNGSRRAAVLHTTCIQTYLSFWASRFASITVHGALWEWGSPLPSCLKLQDNPLKPNDTRPAP